MGWVSIDEQRHQHRRQDEHHDDDAGCQPPAQHCQRNHNGAKPGQEGDERGEYAYADGVNSVAHGEFY